MSNPLKAFLTNRSLILNTKNNAFAVTTKSTTSPEKKMQICKNETPDVFQIYRSAILHALIGRLCNCSALGLMKPQKVITPMMIQSTLTM